MEDSRQDGRPAGELVLDDAAASSAAGESARNEAGASSSAGGMPEQMEAVSDGNAEDSRAALPDEAEGGPMPPGCAAWQKTSLMIAARHGQAGVVSRFLETSCSQPQLDVVDEYGNTALMIACREGHAAVVNLLIKAGADVSIVNADGQRACDLASIPEIRAMVRGAEAEWESITKAIFGSRDASCASESMGAAAVGPPAKAGASLAALFAGINMDAAALNAGGSKESPF